MPKILDLVGERFGDLTVKEYAGKDKWRTRYWLCECTCGNTVKVRSTLLTLGLKDNCGCKSLKKQNLINQKFGNLTVKKFAGYDKHKNRLWLCECTCGNKVKVATTYLITGQKVNCGCEGARKPNLVNRKFGDLTVKKFAGINKKGSRLWLCECICGNTAKVATKRLTSGQKTHCGCKSIRKRNLVNQKFGDLTVKEFAGIDKWKRRIWICDCTCGNTVKVASNQLTSGRKTHCGCKNLKKQVFINQKFGNLTVKEFAGLDKRGNRIWLCECTCGATVIVSSNQLTSGRKTHCGCKRGYNRVFLDQRSLKEKNASLYKKYIERKNRKKFIMPSLEEIKIWDKKFTILELIKKKLRETSNMDELDSFLTLLSTKKINM